MSKERLILLLLCGGFLTLGIEVRYLHRDIVSDHWVGWIPIVLSALSAIGCLAAAFGGSGLRTTASIVFALGFLAGFGGVYYHTELKPEPFLRLVTETGSGGHSHDGHEGSGESSDVPAEEPPALAPLSLSGLCAVGFVLLRPSRNSAGG